MTYRELLLNLVKPKEHADILKMLADGDINRNQAKEVLDILFYGRKKVLDELIGDSDHD